MENSPEYHLGSFYRFVNVDSYDPREGGVRLVEDLPFPALDQEKTVVVRQYFTQKAVLIVQGTVPVVFGRNQHFQLQVYLSKQGEVCYEDFYISKVEAKIRKRTKNVVAGLWHDLSYHINDILISLETGLIRTSPGSDYLWLNRN